MVKAWLGLGSNLQQPSVQLRTAIRRLSEADDLEVLQVSSFYQTPPWGVEKQDDFVNAVVKIETSLDSISLLGVLQSIENGMGRKRDGHRWGPRLIDIDLLLFGDQRCCSRELELPHPRMHERAFVLVPLSELDVTLEIPGRGAINSLLKQLDCSSIHQINEEG